MSSLTNITKVVWRIRILRVDKYGEESPVTDWQEFDNEGLALQEATAQVEWWIDQTNIHHEAEIQCRVVPLYF